MICEPLPADIRVPSGPQRSGGIHVSKVIRNIAVETGLLKKEWVDDLSLVEVGNNEEWWNSLKPADRLKMSIGLAWEQWYVPQIGDVILHPGEMHIDGIYMTHDGESLDVIVTPEGQRHILCLHEVKATYKSTKTVGNLETQWMWIAQTKAYCKGLNTLVAYVHVLFVCGDYSYPIRPQLKVWRITYTQAEIDDNWELMRGYVHHHQQQDMEDDIRGQE